VSMCRRAASVVVWDGGQGEWARAKRQYGFEAQKKNDWGKIRTARAGVD
jgi:hypothetical protein